MFDVFEHFITKVATQLEWKVRTLQTNQDREYLFNLFKKNITWHSQVNDGLYQTLN